MVVLFQAAGQTEMGRRLQRDLKPLGWKWGGRGVNKQYVGKMPGSWQYYDWTWYSERATRVNFSAIHDFCIYIRSWTPVLLYHWGRGVEMLSKKIYQVYSLCSIWVLLLVYEKCFSEGIICDSANPRFICRRRINKWMCAQKSQYTEMKKATEDKTQYVCV